MNFDKFKPKLKIGFLQPGAVIDISAFEFYRLAPPGAMTVMIGIGLTEFSSQDVDRVFKPIDQYVDYLVDRGVQIIVQNGVPLPLLIGLDKHDSLLEHISDRAKLPSTSTTRCVLETAVDLGVKTVVAVNKWTDEMNATLAVFFRRVDVDLIGTSTMPSEPKDFHKIEAGDHMMLAYKLGRSAFLEHPHCDCVYIGGGSWIAEPVAHELEREFGRPVLCNQTSVIRQVLKTLGAWTPSSDGSMALARH
jgi:maleate cis-trans isomerase